MAFIDTPRTDVGGNLTFLDTRANAIDDMSIEASFQEPKKPEHNLVEQMKRKRNAPATAVRTPSARAALNELSSRKLQPVRRSGEFTPLMQSVTKKNASRVISKQTPEPVKAGEFYRSGDPMPQFLKDDLARNHTPLTKPEFSFVSHNSSIMPSGESILRPPDSSGYSTPMHFPGRGEGALGDGRNIMNLKEQERLVDKIEKENFGLKLKIHFLEQKLSERDPNFNENALKENNQLKIDRVIMQKELNKIKKQLAKAEKEAEALRLELRDAQASAEREEELQRLEDECNELQTQLDKRTVDIERKDAEIERLNDQMEDLQDSNEKDAKFERMEAELDRLETELDRREAELENLKEQLDKQETSAEKDDEIRHKDEEIERLKEEIDELRAYDERDDQLARKDAEIERLQEQVEDLETSDEKDVELSRKEAEVDKLQQRVEELQAALDDDRHSTAVAELQADLDKREIEIYHKDEELLDLREQLQAAKALADSKDHTTELQQLRSASRQKDSALEDSATEIRRLRDQLAKLQDLASSRGEESDRLRELQTAHREQETALDRKDTELRNLRRQMEDQQMEDSAKLRELRVAQREKEATLESKDAELQKVRQQLEDQQADLRTKSYSPRMNKLREDVDRKDSDLRRKDVEVERLEREVKRLAAAAEAKTNELTEARKASRVKEDKAAELQKSCEAKDRQIAKMLADHDSFAKRRESELAEARDSGTAFAEYQASKAKDMTTQVESLEMALEGKDRDLQAVLQELHSKEKEWERERARVRFVNTSMSSDGQAEKVERLQKKHDERHGQLKLKYRKDVDLLAREIKWLRAKAEREQGFRTALAHEKTYLAACNLQYADFNALDLELLADMNCRAEDNGAKQARRPSSKLAAALHAVRFTVRLQRLASAWSKHRELRPLREPSSSAARLRSEAKAGRRSELAVRESASRSRKHR